MKKNLDILAAAAMTFLALAAFAWADGGFRFFGPVNRAFTPNVSNANAIFCFDNPYDSGVSGTIYSLLGSQVADLEPGLGVSPTCPQPTIPGQINYIRWDGRSNGTVVTSGVYIYQIKAEGLSFTGALLVVR